MSIQQRNRFAVASPIHTDWPHAASAVLLSAVAVPPIGFLLLVRTPLALPTMSVIALASAAIIAFAAWCIASGRNSTGISLWDISGLYALIGFVAAMLSDPQQVMELWSVPAETHR